MTAILGINAYHADAAAALLVDGKLVAAAEEERFTRVKHQTGFPAAAVRYCLAEAGAGLGDLDAVAVNQDSRANLWRKIGFVARRRPDLAVLRERVRHRRERAGLEPELARAVPGQEFRGRTVRVEHHLAHLSSAFHFSPFDAASVVSVDGFGDFASGAWGVGRGGELRVAGRSYFPHSLGIFYQALTQYLGFPHYGDEYKVMGLAPLGRPRHLDALRRLVVLEEGGGYRLGLDYFRHHAERIDHEWQAGTPVVGRLFGPALEDLLGPAREEGEPLAGRHRDVARSVQAMYEEAFFHLLAHRHRRDGLDDLALAGGCAMNSVANGKVPRMTPFRRVYVQAAAGDAGGAVGAAWEAWRETAADAPRFAMDHAYWGPEFDERAIRESLAAVGGALEAHGCRRERVAGTGELCRRTARAIADGKVVGWFQGRMEWGPRALGNRSILGDPRRRDMKDLLNRKIKRRESFRPFAPSILREAVADWFEADADVPFMTQVLPVRSDRREQVPAVTHVDGSGRLHTVSRSANPRFHALIEAFREVTGVPMVLNTSFNENEPVVCHPREALDCFLRTGMDVLVLGDWYLERPPAGRPDQ